MEKEASSKTCNEYIKFYNQNYNNLTKLTGTFKSVAGSSHALKEPAPQQQNSSTSFPTREEEPRVTEQMETKQTKQPKPGSAVGSSFFKDSTLIVNESCYWFEFGGCSIGRFSINKLKWKIDSGN